MSQALAIERDVVLELDIETNRPDALSMAGVARDLAAKLDVPFAIPEPPVVKPSGRAPAIATGSRRASSQTAAATSPSR